MKNSWIIAFLVFMFILAIPLEIKIADHLWGEKVPAPHSNYLLHDYRYHFTIIANNTQEEYWKQVLKAAVVMSRREKIALEYYGTRFGNANIKELEKYLEVSILSSVDGILASVPNEPSFLALLNEAHQKNIPVIILANDIENCRKKSFIGINTYHLGFQTGQALSKAMGGVGQVAALVNADFAGASYQQYLKGLQKAIAPYPRLILKLVISSKGESINAEDQTQSLLKNHPEIQAIVCTDPNDTLGVAKVVIDLNRVTQVTIIGRGLTSEISSYLKRGVIWGVLADDPNRLGAEAVTSLFRIKQGKPVKAANFLPLYLITSQNIAQYTERFKIKK